MWFFVITYIGGKKLKSDSEDRVAKLGTQNERNM